ncbi:hypothetical protein CP09DC77_1159B, partial [Chlamydia psittaci 09DC77]
SGLSPGEASGQPQ